MKTKICKCGENRPDKFYPKSYLCKECTKALRKKEYQDRPKTKGMSDAEVEKYLQTHPIKRNFVKKAFINMRHAGLL